MHEGCAQVLQAELDRFVDIVAREMNPERMAVALTLPAAQGAHAHAAGPRTLGKTDFYGYSSARNGSSPSAGTYYLNHDAQAVVAGVSYPRAIDLHSYGASYAAGISLNTARFPGYKAVAFDVGIADGDSVNATANVRVTVNGKTVWRQDVRQGQIAVHETRPFGHGQEVISIVATTAHSPDGFIDVILGHAVALSRTPARKA